MSLQKRIFRQLVSQQLLILFFVLVFVQVLNLLISYCFLILEAKEGFQTQLFKTRVLTKTDNEQTRKRPFSGLL